MDFVNCMDFMILILSWTSRKQCACIGIFKPAEPHSPSDACWAGISGGRLAQCYSN